MQTADLTIDDGIAAPFFHARLAGGLFAGWPDENIDQMLVAPVNKRGDGPAIEVIQPATHQRKPLSGEIPHVGREIEFAVEPRFYSVLIAGGNIRQMPRHQRADMSGYGFVHQPIRRRGSGRPQEEDCQRHSRRSKGERLPEAQRLKEACSGFLRLRAKLPSKLVAERGGRGMAQCRLAESRFECMQRFELGSARRTALQMGFKFDAARSVQFAVRERVEERPTLRAVHTFSFRVTASCNCRRARASRDMTVPTGTSATSAISL